MPTVRRGGCRRVRQRAVPIAPAISGIVGIGVIIGVIGGAGCSAIGERAGPGVGLPGHGDEGYGFLRAKGYLPSREDAYIPVKLARQFGLRKGDQITGLSRPAGRNEKNPALLEVLTVNGGNPEAAKRRPRFEDLTALFPDENLYPKTAAIPPT